MTHSFEGTLTNTFRVVLGGTTFATLFTTLPWATACFLQSYLPASILSTRRFFVQGFLAGFPIMALPSNAVPEIMFMLSRMSADSWWKVAVKQKRVKSRRCVHPTFLSVEHELMVGSTQRRRGHLLCFRSWSAGCFAPTQQGSIPQEQADAARPGRRDGLRYQFDGYPVLPLLMQTPTAIRPSASSVRSSESRLAFDDLLTREPPVVLPIVHFPPTSKLPFRHVHIALHLVSNISFRIGFSAV